MELFLNPDPQTPGLSAKELACLVHPGSWWHCTTAEFKILILVILMLVAVIVMILKKNNQG